MTEIKKRRNAVEILSGSADFVIEGIVDALNGSRREWVSHYTQEDVVKLRRLVLAWIDHRDNGSRRLSQKIGLLQRGLAKPDFREMELSSVDRADIGRHMDSIRTSVIRVSTGHYQLRFQDFDTQPRDVAVMEFVMLLLNPLSYKLSGPCPAPTERGECGKWFIKKTKKARVYCSTKCANNAMQQRKRGNDLQVKIEAAQKAIDRYESRPAKYRNLDWKSWAAEAAECEPKSITRWINRGDLRSPGK